MGYSISLAVSVNKLTSDSIQTVRVMIRCGEFVCVCTIVGFIECSNKLVHCIVFQFAIVWPISLLAGVDSLNFIDESLW